MSSLQRLFTYAKAGVEAREDFTTEALAIAIRHNPGPLVMALRTAGLVPQSYELASITPHTQYWIADVGRIDLVVRFALDEGAEEMWFEVKVDAPESGDQLDRYLAHLASVPQEFRPRLVTLAKVAIREDPTIPFVGWDAIHRAAVESGDPHWEDLADWLEELGMTDEYLAPISADELAALPSAAQLFEKVSRVLAAVVEEATEDYPGLAWPSPSRVRNAVQGELAFRGRFMLRVPPTAGDTVARLYMGAFSGDTAQLGIWVESDPKHGPFRRQLVAFADAHGLGADWRRQVDTWQALLTTCPDAETFDQDAVRDWFLARLAELREAGIIEAVCAPPPGNAAETADDAAF